MGGPGSAPQPPVITWVRYDDGVLAVAWSGPGKPNAGVTYVVQVVDDDRTVAEAWAGAATDAALPLHAVPGEVYRARIAMYNLASGPTLSPEVTIVTDTSTVERAETDPVTGAVTLTWKAADTDEFLLRYVVNGTAPGPEVPVSGGSFVIDLPPPAGSTVAAALARVRTGQDAVSIGPHGPALAAPTERPELVEAAYDAPPAAGPPDAGLLAVAWTAVPAADAYRVSVLDEGGLFFRAAEVRAPVTTAGLDPGLVDGGTYRVVVQAVNGVGSGPPSAPLAVQLAAPGITAVTSDAATVSVAVVPPEFTPTGYDVVLLRDGVPVRRETVAPASTLSLAVPGPLPRGAAYAV
ncbi:fibronectin type III domain-containing protein, partial [Kitasatospora sp. NPDC047058]|uniref:fibronectin type III domain-containing protein n=1 Tax=Kitasatospora sp. NPDC047058 TaxID=3155620 RepID=UPI0033E880DC